MNPSLDLNHDLYFPMLIREHSFSLFGGTSDMGYRTSFAQSWT